MVESKPSCPPEGNELNIPTDGNKGQVSKPKKYRGKKQPRNKSSLEPETETTSRAGVLTWKATLLTLDQEHLTSSPEK